MKIQPGSATMGYFKTLKNEEAKGQNIAHLFLDEEEEKNIKPRFEVRNEGGYIRKYIVKANGDRILIMETKQTEVQEGMPPNETGDLMDIAHDMLMKQLEKSANSQIKEKTNTPAWEKKAAF